MGVLADQFALIVDQMRESDRKTEELLRKYHRFSHDLLDSVRDCAAIDPDPADAISDAIELLQSHGYRITPPA